MRAFAAGEVGEPAAFAHGTTVATNALLERRGARTALVTTRGFRDVIEIGRQDRADLYDLTAVRPPPLVPRELRFTVGGRMGPDGELEPLDDDDVAAAVDAVREAEAESVAVCLLFSFLHPDARAGGRGGAARGAAGRARLPLLRGAAGVPRVRALLHHDRRRLPHAAAGRLPAPAGASARRRRASRRRWSCSRRAAWSTWPRRARAPRASSSPGPAGGVVGAAYVARAERLRGPADLRHGRHEHRRRARAAAARRAPRPSPRSPACPITLPVVDLHTVSAGRRLDRVGRRRAARCASGRGRPARSRARPPTTAAARSRRSRTPTSSSATSPTAPSSAGSWCCGASWPSGRSPRSASGSGSTRSRRRSASCGWPTPR